MYRDARPLEYHRHGLRLGSMVVYVLQGGAVEEGIFAYRGHARRDAYLLYARAVPEYAPGYGSQRGGQLHTLQVVAAGKGIEFQGLHSFGNYQ